MMPEYIFDVQSMYYKSHLKQFSEFIISCVALNYPEISCSHYVQLKVKTFWNIFQNYNKKFISFEENKNWNWD